MCRHVLNAQVYIQGSCCGRWFECSECHDEMCPDHQFCIDRVMRLTCKVCRRAFQKDLTALMESDKYCEQCHTLWCVPGVTPESLVYHESMEIVEEMFDDLIENVGLVRNEEERLKHQQMVRKPTTKKQ